MRSNATDRSLAAIAGAPLAIFEGTPGGTQTLPGNAISGTAPRTLYTVFTENTPVPLSSVSNIVVYGTTGLNDTIPNNFMTLRMNQGATLLNSRGVFLRRSNAGGVIKNVGARPIGSRYVVTWGINEEAKMFLGLDGDAIVTDDVPMNVAHNQYYHANSANFTPVRTTLVYLGLHTPSQRKRIEAWLLSRRYDIERLEVQQGPNGSVDGVFDSTYSVPGGVGPTGLAIGRMTKNTAGNISYGSYIKGSRASYTRTIATGTQVSARVWVRTSWTGSVTLYATNDQATYSVASPAGYATTANTWQLLEWTFTCTQPFRPTENIRTSVLAGVAGNWVEFSDPSIEVLL